MFPIYSAAVRRYFRGVFVGTGRGEGKCDKTVESLCKNQAKLLSDVAFKENSMKHALVAAVFLSLAASASAQNRGDITINVGTASSLNCTTTTGESGFNAASWSISGSNSKKATGGAAGKTSLAELVVNRNVDTCSEQLVRNFVSGQFFPTLVLTQYGATGQRIFPKMVVTLSNVFIDNYTLGGTTSVRPTEAVSFLYQKVCIATTPVNLDGSLGQAVSVCYNSATGIES
jgi:type VI protein secretion system component Hcp